MLSGYREGVGYGEAELPHQFRVPLQLLLARLKPERQELTFAIYLCTLGVKAGSPESKSENFPQLFFLIP